MSSSVTPRGERPPLSFAQHRLWFLHQLEPASTAYIVEAVDRYDAVDVDVLRRALEAVVARNEILRTTFPAIDGEPYQQVHPPAPWPLPVEDARSRDADEVARALARVADEQHQTFDLVTGPLLRTRAVMVADDALVLHVTFHHIIIDVDTLELFRRELRTCYGALAAGKLLAPPPSEQYVDYARWERAWLSGPELERQLAFWTKQLRDAPEETTLPFKGPRPARQTFGGRTLGVALPATLSAELRALARDHRATLFLTVAAALRAVLVRYTGQADILLGTVLSHRAAAGFEDLIGVFQNPLVLRNEVRDDDTFASLLTRERNGALDVYDNLQTPFDLVVAALGVERSVSRVPLFQVLYVHAGEQIAAPDMTPKPTTTTVDLTMTSAEHAGQLYLEFFYNTDLFDHELIDQLARHLVRQLKAAVANADQPLAAVDLLDDEDHALLRGWSGNARMDEAPFVHELVADQVARAPEAIAVDGGNARLTYAELASRGARVAGWLAHQGVSRGDRVAICIERSVDMVVAIVGVLQLGAAYVPIDPEYPAARREFMCRDTGAKVELTDVTLRTALASTADAPCAEVAPDDTAYIIYTSGSTGTPKGVQVPHRSLASYLAAMRGSHGVEAADTVAAIASLSFDAHVIDLLLPLARGARIVVADRDTTRDGERLAKLLDDSGVTFMFATPATWRALLATGWRPSPRLRIHCGGEAWGPELATVLVRHAGSVWNGYGPTETTVYATCMRMELGQPHTIGRPLPNTCTYVLDRALRETPVGVAGELYIGGRGVAGGYHARPGLTAERFLPDLFSDRPGARMYRSGDRARWTREGTLEYLGRVDNQVKLRGLRIELGEIESAIRTHAQVEDAAVLLREDVAGNPQLVAYIATRAQLEQSSVRTALRATLPEYMIPSAIIALPALPLTSNGKLDRRALPAPDLAATPAYVAPRDPIEEAVARSWRDILGIERVGVHDDFFVVGGHSLVASRVISRLRAELDVVLPTCLLFELPTVEKLAREIARRRTEAISG